MQEVFSDAGPLRQAKVLKGGRGLLRFVLAADASRCASEMQNREVSSRRCPATEIDLQSNRLSSADTFPWPGDQVCGKSVSLSLSGPDKAVVSTEKSAFEKPIAKLNPRLFRLVIRNLPFAVKESAIRAAFERFGR